MTKNLTLTAVLHKEDDMYVATCPELGTVSQGYTIDEAVANLKEATELYLEEFPLKEETKPLITVFEARRRKGSHVVMIKETAEGKVGCTVPMHPRVKQGTLKGILNQAKVSEEQFLDVL